jgi:hypothetical protein
LAGLRIPGRRNTAPICPVEPTAGFDGGFRPEDRQLAISARQS